MKYLLRIKKDKQWFCFNTLQGLVERIYDLEINREECEVFEKMSVDTHTEIVALLSKMSANSGKTKTVMDEKFNRFIDIVVKALKELDEEE